MRIPTFIMAGGKGKRMGVLQMEKPLMLLLGKPLIDWVVEAVASAKTISEFLVITSANTSKTEERCRLKGWQYLRTDAKGYHDDLKQAAREASITGSILTVPADLPAITGNFLDKIINTFAVSEKDFLAVFVPIERREQLGLSVDSTDEYNGVWYAVSGVNIVNGKKIQGDSKVETNAIITDAIEVLLNINTMKDLRIAKRLMDANKC